jgi:lambda family phage portal protein
MNISAYVGRMLDALGWRPQERSLTWARATDSREDITGLDRMRLVALSRKCYYNNAIVKSAITDIARYAVGGGIRVMPKSGDESWDEKAKDWWSSWCVYPEVSGKFDFPTLQLLISEALDRDGEIFIVLTKTKDGTRAQLQVVEGHRVQTPPEHDGKDNFFDGVQIDNFGRAKAYYILQNDGSFRRIDAEDMVHIFEPERADQVRGYPRIAVAINTVLDRDELLRLEMQATKAASTISMVAISKNGGGAGIFGPTTQDDQKTLETVWGGGALIRLRGDQDLKSFQLNRPNDRLDQHLEQYIRAACLGLQLPYEFVWDSSKVSGANTRLVTAKAARRFEQRQNLLIAQALRRIWRYAIAVAIKNGELPATPGWNSTSWICPRSITVDHGRDAQSDIALVEAGLMSREEYFGSYGQDWEEQTSQISKEKALLGPVAPVQIPAPLPAKPSEALVGMPQA